MSDTPMAGPMGIKMMKVRGEDASMADLLSGMMAVEASDLFLKVGSPIRFKIAGRVVAFDSDRVTKETMEWILNCFLDEDDRIEFRTRMTADVVYASDQARYRVHFARGQTGPYATIRLISSEIRSFEELGLPAPVVRNMGTLTQGLLIVAGSTDAGKTVTCTSLLDHIARSRQVAMLTLEDPIEYILDDDKALVFQREVGVHAPSFAEGVRGAMRENLDVIFVGEVRDNETIEQVLRAAEMGHLVITTLHCDDVLAAISRMVGSFPQADQPRIRHALAGTLVGVVFQKLLASTEGGRTPCVEALWPNSAVRAILRSGDLGKLGTYTGAASGGLAYRECLQALKTANRISPEVFDGEEARLRTGV